QTAVTTLQGQPCHDRATKRAVIVPLACPERAACVSTAGCRWVSRLPASRYSFVLASPGQHFTPPSPTQSSPDPQIPGASRAAASTAGAVRGTKLGKRPGAVAGESEELKREPLAIY